MTARTATAVELAEQTTKRILERLAGLSAQRPVPWSTDLDIAVFNPSPFPRTDVVAVELDGFPMMQVGDDLFDVHPLSLGASLAAGYLADGEPVRTTPSADPGRVRLLEDFPALDLELVVTDVPAFGWRRVSLTAAEAHPDEVDEAVTIATDDLEVTVADDGTLTLTAGGHTYTGLAAVDDIGDRGDTYDHDPVSDGPGAELAAVTVERRRHPSGIQRLVVTRTFAVPVGLTPDRERRADETVALTLRTEARVAPGVARVDLHVDLDDPAADHRLRLLFPTGAETATFRTATTFGVANRATEPPEAHGWLHPPPPTFPHQGWIEANGLVVAAPGLPEGEVGPDGTIAVTLLRSVGFLTHMDVRTRPLPAGPGLATPEAQCREGIERGPGPVRRTRPGHNPGRRTGPAGGRRRRGTTAAVRHAPAQRDPVDGPGVSAQAGRGRRRPGPAPAEPRRPTRAGHRRSGVRGRAIRGPTGRVRRGRGPERGRGRRRRRRRTSWSPPGPCARSAYGEAPSRGTGGLPIAQPRTCRRGAELHPRERTAPQRRVTVTGSRV